MIIELTSLYQAHGYKAFGSKLITLFLRTCLVNFLVKNGIKYLASSRVNPLRAFLPLILHSSSVSWSASTALPCGVKINQGNVFKYGNPKI